MSERQIIAFEGKMNMDLSPELMNGKDYSYAKGVQFLTNNTGSTGNHIPMLGNTPAFDLGSVSTQNKIWRIYTRQLPPATNSFHLHIFDQNGNDFGNVIVDMAKPVTGGVSQTTDVATFINAINLTPAVTGTATSATEGYIDIEMDLFTGYDIAFTIGVSTPGVSFEPYLELRQESYDISLTGELHDIEGNDMLGDLYIWSTPQTHLPESRQVTITAIVDHNLTGRFALTFSTSHGLTTGTKVVFSGTGTAIDGAWIITVLTPTSIVLEEYYIVYTPIATPLTATMTLYTEAVGEIGVGVKDIDTGLWAYTRLLRTKEWNFRTKKQIDGRPSTRTIGRDSMYFSDDYNNPRCFYYTKPFTLDGALAINGGRYSYGSIAEETTNILSNTGAKITFSTQVQSGGSVPSGNWRYAIQFRNDTLASTEPSQLTNPVSVCTATIANVSGVVSKIVGDQPHTITPKVNELTVTGITPGLYKYIELIGINYVGDAIEGFILNRILLDGYSTTMTIQHTGNESGIVDLDLALLNKISASIKTAKSNEIIDNRLIYSNLTFNQQKDLSAWALTFEHTIQKQSLQSAGSVAFGLILGEYQEPGTVNAYAGYMQNEVNRFAVRVRFIDGKFWSNPFFVDDIAFTTFATNLKPDGLSPASQWSDPIRRNGNAGFSNFDMTDFSVNTTTTAYAPYVRFENIDLDFLVDGIPIRKLVDKIEFVRAETIKEVLATGVGILSVSGAAYTGESGGGTYIFSSETPAVNPPVTFANRIDYPFVSGHSGAAITTNPLYPYDSLSYPAEGANFVADRKYCSFYSPDVFFNNTEIGFAVTDKIINYGNPRVCNFVNGITAASPGFSNYAQYSGQMGVNNTTVETFTPTDFVLFFKGQGPTALNGANYSKLNYLTTAAAAAADSDNAGGYVIRRAVNIGQPTAFSDYGLRYLQYYREIVDKYGDPAFSVYVSCGSIMDVSTTTTSPATVNLFGGDTFTQISYFKHRYGNDVDNGVAGGITFYSQNRVNTQMKMIAAGTTQRPFPGITDIIWLESQNQVNEDYQSGYTIRNEVQSYIGFNSNIESVAYRPNWFQWSDINLGDSPTDSYRSFPPGNFHVLNATYGAIQHHANANGELVSWQDRAFMRQYFNTRGTLQVKDITEVLIGDGSVMSRDGVTLSRFGSLHKWGVIQGVSPNGDDVFMWINSEMKNVGHYAANGTLTISDEGVKAFFANNLTWIQGKDTPADGDGICGAYEQRFNNFLFTVKGRIDPAQSFDEYNASIGYTTGDKVFFTVDPFNTIGDVYESIDLGINLGNQPNLFPLKWKKLPDDGTYFNRYTIVFNGYKAGFIGFAPPVPNIYNRWQNTFLSPRPISPVSKIYEHNQGNYLTWYEYLEVSQQEQGVITGVVNKFPELTKWYTALGIDCNVQPDSMDFSTKNHISFLITSDFEYYEDSWFSPIKEDSTSNGLNDSNTTLLWGKWLKLSFNFAVGTYQQLSNITVKMDVSNMRK